MTHKDHMSAEERATAFINEISDGWGESVERADIATLALVIKAAENAAYERVAIEAEAKREKNASSPASKAAYSNIALFARSLKHKDTQ